MSFKSEIEDRFLILTNESKFYTFVCESFEKFKAGDWAANTVIDKVKGEARNYITSSDSFSKYNPEMNVLTYKLLEYYTEEHELPRKIFSKFKETVSEMNPDDKPPSPAMADLNNETAQSTQPTKETKPMKLINTVTYVNGTDITTMSDKELYSVIAKQEAEVSELNKILNKPQKLIDEIKQRHADIQELVALIDAR